MDMLLYFNSYATITTSCSQKIYKMTDETNKSLQTSSQPERPLINPTLQGLRYLLKSCQGIRIDKNKTETVVDKNDVAEKEEKKVNLNEGEKDSERRPDDLSQTKSGIEHQYEEEIVVGSNCESRVEEMEVEAAFVEGDNDNGFQKSSVKGDDMKDHPEAISIDDSDSNPQKSPTKSHVQPDSDTVMNDEYDDEQMGTGVDRAAPIEENKFQKFPAKSEVIDEDKKETDVEGVAPIGDSSSQLAPVDSDDDSVTNINDDNNGNGKTETSETIPLGTIDSTILDSSTTHKISPIKNNHEGNENDKKLDENETTLPDHKSIPKPPGKENETTASDMSDDDEEECWRKVAALIPVTLRLSTVALELSMSASITPTIPKFDATESNSSSLEPKESQEEKDPLKEEFPIQRSKKNGRSLKRKRKQKQQLEQPKQKRFHSDLYGAYDLKDCRVILTRCDEVSKTLTGEDLRIGNNDTLNDCESPNKPYTCPFCVSGFVKFADIVAHISEFHKEGVERKNNCTRCEKSFRSPYDLKRHMEAKGHFVPKANSTESKDRKEIDMQPQLILTPEKVQSSLKVEAETNDTRCPQSPYKYRCKQCKMGFLRENLFKLHLRSKFHQSQARNAKE